MVAEDQPVCTICGVPVAIAGRMFVHLVDGRTELMLMDPYRHDATTDPQPARA